MFKMDNRSAMGIAEGIGHPFIAIEIYLIKIPSNLSDSAAIDGGRSPRGFDVKAGPGTVHIGSDDQGVIPEFDGSNLDAGASISQLGSYLRRNHLDSALEPDATVSRALRHGEGEMSVFILLVVLHRRSEPMIITLSAQKTRSEWNLRVEDDRSRTCLLCRDREVDGVFSALQLQIECSMLQPNIAYC